jgi:hypothetical protein
MPEANVATISETTPQCTPKLARWEPTVRFDQRHQGKFDPCAVTPVLSNRWSAVKAVNSQAFYEAVSERKSIPPLSQSRYGDMACETLYVQKHVNEAILGESEPAPRGIEIH